MAEPRTMGLPILPRTRRFYTLLLSLAFLAITILKGQAVLQFDVFPGHDGVVPEASWFPIVCEIKNDGPAFTGVVEISGGRFGEGQTRQLKVELPTGTLKRVEIPVFSTARYQSSWDVRLLDERGRIHAEQTGVRPRRQIASATSLIGALPRTATGVPALRPVKVQDSELQPTAARLQPSLVPDDPLVLEGMDTLYLNSERAADLNDHQVFALLAWLNDGGHLIVGIEQIPDVTGVPWLKKIVPCDLKDMQTISSHRELQEWLRGNVSAPVETDTPKKGKRTRPPIKTQSSNYNPYSDVVEDPDFEKTDIQLVTGPLRDATVLASAGSTPLMITSHEGRGRVTALMFSPERKPFTTWKNLPSFWSKLVEVSPDLYASDNNNTVNNLRGGWSIDGVFGAMIDSKQVRKLPVEWLLLLLIVYLIVIGPLDQYWLKRIKRPMLTWITFPCYVVLFSLLIYFIGYKLRAGETEWNELHLVDVLPNGDGAELRGHTYASIYSPVNADYEVGSQERFAAFRGEFQSSWNGGQAGERADVFQAGDNFKARIHVPVWTSQLYVSDWLQPSELPLKLSVAQNGNEWDVTVVNAREHALSNACLVVNGRIMQLGELAARQTKTFKLGKEQGEALRDFVSRRANNFQNASNARQQAFGASGGGHIGDLPESTVAVSFISNLSNDRFICPPGLDLSPLVERGNAVLLAWEANYSPVKPLRNFVSTRGRTDTLWRVAVPISASTGQ